MTQSADTDQLRTPERIAHLASAVAIILTIVMVGTNQAAEANPVSAWIIAHGGFAVWGILAPIAILALFGLARRLSRGFSLLGCDVSGDARTSRVGAWLFTSFLVADATGNAIFTAMNGFPPLNWSTFGPLILGVSMLPVAFAFRWTLLPAGSRVVDAVSAICVDSRSRHAIIFSLILVVSITAPYLSPALSPIGVASADSDDDFTTYTENDSNNHVEVINATALNIIESGANASYGVYTTDSGAIDTSETRYAYFNLTVTNQSGTNRWTYGLLPDGASASSGNIIGLQINGGSWQLNGHSTSESFGTVEQGDEDFVELEFDHAQGGMTVNIYETAAADIPEHSATVDINNDTYSRLYAGIGSGGSNTGDMDLDVRDHDVTTSERKNESGLSSFSKGGADAGRITRINDSAFEVADFAANADAYMYANNKTIDSSGVGIQPGEATDFSFTVKPINGSPDGRFYIGFGTDADTQGSIDFLGVYYNAERDQVEITNKSKLTASVLNTNITYGESRHFEISVDGSGTMKAKMWESPARNTLIDENSTGYNSSTNFDHIMAATSQGGTNTGDFDANVTDFSPGATLEGRTSDAITGRVTDQNGNAVEDAVVMGYVAQYATPETSRDKLTEFANPEPPGWVDQGKTNVHLLGENGEFTGAESYVAVHGPDSVQSTAPWVDSADLTNPRLKLPANEDIVLSVWDGTASGFGTNRCIPSPTGSEYDCQLPGEHKQDATIMVERLDGGGDVLGEPSELKTTEVVGGGLGDPDQFHHATANLNAGFYRFYEKGAANKGPVYLVGDPAAMVERNLETAAGKLSNQSNKVKDAVNAGDLSRVTTKSGPDGKFTLQMPKQAQAVTVQAIKPPDAIQTSATDLDVATLNTRYNEALTASSPTATQRDILNSSVYLPSRTQTVTPPSSGVTIEMMELSSPPGANASALQDQIKDLRDRLNNQSFSDLKGTLQEQLENVDRGRLEDLHNELDTLREQNGQLEQRYEDLLATQLNESNPSLDVNLNDTSDAELRSRIQALQQSVTELQSTVDTDPGEITQGTDTLTYRQRFGAPIEPEQVTVIADWANGSSQVVSDEYITVNNDIENIAGVGGSEIVVSEFPISSDDPKAVSFRVLGATEDGFAKTSKSAKNPTFNGELPSVQSISVSSLEPAANSSVNLRVNPGSGSIQQISGLTVYGPNGQQVGSPSTNGREATFNTDAGPGVYSIEAELETSDGVTVTETLRLPVSETDSPRKPSIRAKESAIGAYAIVGDGISNGDVVVENGGSSVDVLAQLEDDADVPNRIHVYTESLSLPSDADTNIRVVRGAKQESVNRHVRVTLHTQSVPEDGLIWRNGDPIPKSEESQYGSVTETGNGLSIQTYTDGTGTATIKTQSNPSVVDEAQFWVESNVNFDDLSPLMTSPAMPGPRTERTATAD